MAITQSELQGGASSAQEPSQPGKAADLTASLIRKRWEEGSRALDRERRWYWEHLAFQMGYQWIRWDEWRTSLVDLSDPRFRLNKRLRFTANRIGPNLDNLFAKLTKSELSFEVLASAADDPVISGARTAERILAAFHYEQNWEYLRLAELQAAYFGGTSAISVEWDPSADVKLEVDQITNKVVGTGDIRLTALPITEFVLEPDVRNLEMARYWIRGVAMPPKVAQERYGLKEKPKSDLGPAATPLQDTLFASQGRPNQDVTLVLTYFERPTNDSPGRVATVIGDKFVDGPSPWPFPFKHLNLALFRQTHIPGRWAGYTRLHDAVPVQVQYNVCRSAVQEHLKMAGNARLGIPEGSVDDPSSWTDEPGEIFFFNAQAGGAPIWVAPPNLPRWVIIEADKLQAELDDIMSVHAVSRGQGGADSSGQALALLAEKDDSPLGLVARDQSEGWADVGTMVLELLADKVTETRKAKVPSAGSESVPSNFAWTGKMLEGQTDVKVPIESVSPHSQAAAMAMAVQMTQLGVSPPTPQAFAKLMRLDNVEYLTDIVDMDVAKAVRENDMMAMGKIPGPVGLPALFDDHPQHIAEHNRMRKSATYEFADPAIRELFDKHVQAHENLQAEQQAKQYARSQSGLDLLPQGNEPPGSPVPPDSVEKMSQQNTTNQGTPPNPASQSGSAPSNGMGGQGGGIPRTPQSQVTKT